MSVLEAPAAGESCMNQSCIHTMWLYDHIIFMVTCNMVCVMFIPHSHSFCGHRPRRLKLVSNTNVKTFYICLHWKCFSIHMHLSTMNSDPIYHCPFVCQLFLSIGSSMLCGSRCPLLRTKCYIQIYIQIPSRPITPAPLLVSHTLLCHTLKEFD